MGTVTRPAALCVSFLTALTLLLPAYAATAPLAEDAFLARQKSFIGRLYTEKDYFNCIAETRRLISRFPGLSQTADYLYSIEMNYFLWGQYKTAAARYEHTPGASFRRALLGAEAYGALNRHDRALEILGGLEKKALSLEERRAVLLRSTDHLLYKAEYGAALLKARSWSADFPDDTAVSSLARDLARYRELPFKSPALAAGLSALLPGAGQLYAGRPRDGVISIVSLGVLTAGSLLSFRRGNRTAGASLGVMAALVYGGTVLGARNAAEARNRRVHGSYQDSLRRDHIPPYAPEKYFSPGFAP